MDQIEYNDLINQINSLLLSKKLDDPTLYGSLNTLISKLDHSNQMILHNQLTEKAIANYYVIKDHITLDKEVKEHYILSDEPFPLPVKGQHSVELLNNCLLFESDNDDEFDAWFDTKQEWEFKHSWFSNRAGSFLPDIFFRRVDDEIEIAWNNESTYTSEGISFINPIGIEYVPLTVFESTIKNFIEDFLDNLLQSSINKCDAEEVYQKIKKLIR